MNSPIPEKMTAVLLTGHGGPEVLEYRNDVDVPAAKAGEVLIKVSAAGVNNTDINTRIGWYSKAITEDTNAGGLSGFDHVESDDASWSGEALKFPRIQGADCCGYIVAVGDNVDSSRIGQRVLVRTIQISDDDSSGLKCITYGSECDGGFAQFATAKSSDALSIQSDMSDVELASFPCAYSTAEGMMVRANISNETVLITGASGGVGSAAVQLAKLRGARVIAISSAAKREDVLAAGADQVVDRNDDIVKILGAESVDVAVDLVAGPNWNQLISVLKRGGRYVTAGAIAGPMVTLDVRDLYLKDLSFFGCTWQDETIFTNLIEYINAGKIKSLVSKTYPLSDIHLAQEAFVSKKYSGKIVLVPPSS